MISLQNTMTRDVGPAARYIRRVKHCAKRGLGDYFERWRTQATAYFSTYQKCFSVVYAMSFTLRNFPALNLGKLTITYRICRQRCSAAICTPHYDQGTPVKML
ncbi:hypothetical protein Syun_006343 [Stephania yunnanensis]|uniref:Uncharacterized protein n=1 Tax=Stephania yunnanensis TaxID=152371 RepID=A0AAP0KWD6_9MAGN